jgi:hypothetical protein
MKYFLLILFLSFNLYGQNLPPYQIINIPQSCFINSILIYEKINKDLKEYNVWSDILAVAFVEKKNGRLVQEAHAVCMVEWKNRLYVYDVNKGTLPVDVAESRFYYKKDHKELAKIIFPDKYIIDSAFLKD